jgi:predicted transcriptional regulator
MLMENWAYGVPSSEVPRQVLRLASREREVATIVYAQTGATARQVEAQLSTVMTNSAVRSMLSRLVRKGILSRRAIEGTRGRGQEFLYLPALTEADLKMRALKRLSEDFFAGSLTETARLLQLLVEQESGRTKPAATARSALR